MLNLNQFSREKAFVFHKEVYENKSLLRKNANFIPKTDIKLLRPDNNQKGDFI
jgi:hypothetical protein